MNVIWNERFRSIFPFPQSLPRLSMELQPPFITMGMVWICYFSFPSHVTILMLALKFSFGLIWSNQLHPNVAFYGKRQMELRKAFFVTVLDGECLWILLTVIHFLPLVKIRRLHSMMLPLSCFIMRWCAQRSSFSFPLYFHPSSHQLWSETEKMLNKKHPLKVETTTFSDWWLTTWVALLQGRFLYDLLCNLFRIIWKCLMIYIFPSENNRLSHEANVEWWWKPSDSVSLGLCRWWWGKNASA